MVEISRKGYEGYGEDFYEKQTRSLNPLRKWFHVSRYTKTRDMVERLYRKGMKIVDLGCGNCVWNAGKIPVMGIDFNRGMLERAKKAGRLKGYCVGDISKTGLKTGTVDLVVISEVLEHVPNYVETLGEIRRILKPGGKLLITVPYDTLFSLWKPLFALQCFLQGYVFGQEAYRKKCGHINRFSPKSLGRLLEGNGFEVESCCNHRFFNIFMLAGKKRAVKSLAQDL